MTKKAIEIFGKNPKPCRAAQEATKRLRKRIRDKGRASRNKKDNGKPFIQETFKDATERTKSDNERAS